jgi:hypothetical protein
MDVPPGGDPVRAQRVRVARWVKLGKRAGYGSLLVAIVAFAVALATDLAALALAVVVAGLVGSALTLLPATIAGYGLRAAEREDLEREGLRTATPRGPRA